MNEQTPIEKVTFDNLPMAIMELLKEVREIKVLLSMPTRITPKQPEYLHSMKELADFLKCSVTLAQAIKNSGKIRYKQYGRKVIFTTSEIMEDILNYYAKRKRRG